MPKWAWPTGGLFLVLGLLFFGLILGSRSIRARIGDLDRYAVVFAEVDCPAPPGLRREEFLDEVQYLSGLPGRLRLLDEDLAQRLAQAFASHPWVEDVVRVEILPARPARVQLTFRTPVLAVACPGLTAEGAGSWPSAARVVDRHGILLPAAKANLELPVLAGRVAPPAGSAGTPWGDPRVAACAATAGFLHANQARFHFQEIQAGDDGVVLTTPKARVLWGNPPGAETAAEAEAAQKLERLLEFCARHGCLDGYEYDVRPPKAPRQHRLAPTQS
jgi:hypothetical protein